ECMLLANQAAARHLHKHKLPGLFRVHEQPDIEVVQELWNSRAELTARFEAAPSTAPDAGGGRGKAGGAAEDGRAGNEGKRAKGAQDIQLTKGRRHPSDDKGGDKGGADIFTKMRETGGYLNPVVQQFYVRLLDPSRGALPPSVQRKIL